MKKSLFVLLVTFCCSFFFAFSSANYAQDAAFPDASGPSGASAASAAAAASPSDPVVMPVGADGFSGTVLETMNSGGYTYVNVDTGKEKIWAAAPACQVKVGDKVEIPAGAPMGNFHSKTLNRDFEVIFFVSTIKGGTPPDATSAGTPAASASLDRANAPASLNPPLTLTASGPNSSAAPAPALAPAGMPPGHPALSHAVGSAPVEIDLSGITKADGGKTIAELYAEKTALAGKEVKVRGRVVKFNSGIMGKNWIHIKDGSGDKDTNDLTVTSPLAVAKPGDTVVVSGVLVTDKDFGAGYKYPIIIEDATLTKE